MICILCYTIPPELICIYHFFPSLHVCLQTVKTMKFELVAWNSSGDNPEPLTLLFGRTCRLSSGCFLVWKSFFCIYHYIIVKRDPNTWVRKYSLQILTRFTGKRMNRKKYLWMYSYFTREFDATLISFMCMRRFDMNLEKTLRTEFFFALQKVHREPKRTFRGTKN